MINESYSLIALKDMLKDRYFEHGISPSTSQIDALAGFIESHRLGLTGSLMSLDTSDLQGSARAIMGVIKTFETEIQSVRLSCRKFNKQTKIFFDRIENRLALLNQQTAELMLNPCALQGARQSGFNLVSTNALNNLNQIDQSRTSVDIDLRSNAARLKHWKNYRRHNLSNLQDKDFDVFLLTGANSSMSQAPGSQFINAIDDSDSFWLHRVVTLENGPKTLVFQMDMGEQFPVSQITFEPLGDDKDGSHIIRVLVSPNGVNWAEVREKIRTTTKNVVIDMSVDKVRYVKLEMTREKPSFQTINGNFTYEFGLNSLRVYETGYYPFGDLVTKPIRFNSTSGEPQRINRIDIEVYEEKPSGTDIAYYIATNSINLDSATRIVPGEEIILDTVKETQTDGKIRSRYDADHALVNITLSNNILPESVRFFRNTYQEGVEIDGIQAGWRYQNSYYSCIFNIKKDMDINLGINFAYLDGRKVNGIQTLIAGWHTFKTHETNWAKANSESTDPLYPNNHKLLIEGLRSSSVYRGVDFLAADELRLVSAFDLLNNIDIAGKDRYFAIYGGYPIIKVPRPPVTQVEIEGWRKEHFSVIYKSPEDKTPITEVVLIAKLTTTNHRISPVFKGFVASAGY